MFFNTLKKYNFLMVTLFFICRFQKNVFCCKPKPNQVPPKTNENEVPRTTEKQVTQTTKKYQVPEFSCRCGISNIKCEDDDDDCGKIIGGKPVDENQYPWLVGLTTEERKLIPFCGGTILSDQTVLTAAHCTKDYEDSPEELKVLVGEHDWTMEDGEEKVSVCDIVPHPSYSRITVDSDFSLLTLCQPLTFRKEVQPICLPTQEGWVYEDVVATIVGWGTTEFAYASEIPREANITTLHQSTCTKAFTRPPAVSANMLCADSKYEIDSCRGDSGGPLMTLDPGNFYVQIGVVSWGRGCADPQYPGVYARVTAQRKFIMENMKGNTCPQGPADTRTVVVAGGWSDWTPWSLCYCKSGGTGLRYSRRMCDNPKPANGGKDCKVTSNCPEHPTRKCISEKKQVKFCSKKMCKKQDQLDLRKTFEHLLAQLKPKKRRHKN